LTMRSPKSGKLYEEIVAQIENGTMALGTRLPTHRDLARRERVSLSVVNRVYSELKRKGLAKASGRRGTVLVSKASPPSSASHRPAAQSGQGSDIIDLSHNYAALPELNNAIKLAFESAVGDYFDD